MSDIDRASVVLDPDGFNRLRMSRSGPMLYNKFDIYIGGSLDKYGEFSQAELELFKTYINPGATVVDAGANIGAHTVRLAKLVGTEGRVYAFEPQRLVFQTLCANIALNQCANVYAYEAALGAQYGRMLVPALSPSTRANFGGVTLIDVDSGESVPVYSLDSLELPACDFLKADVEGMEGEVISGGERTLRKLRPTMYLENDRQAASPRLLGKIIALDYDMYWHLPKLFNPENFAGDAEDVFAGIVSVNILCIPAERSVTATGLRKVTGPDDYWPMSLKK